MLKPCQAVPKLISQGDEDAWMTVVQAAKALECSPQTVYVKALHGELETARAAGRIFVLRASVERLIAAQR